MDDITNYFIMETNISRDSMGSAKSKTRLLSVGAIAIVAIMVAGGWYLLSNDGDDQPSSRNATELANKFIEKYSGPLGPFELDSNETLKKAVIVTENDTPRQKYSRMNFTTDLEVIGSIDEIFAEKKSKIESTPGFMGGAPEEVKGITGFDKVCVYKMDVRMGTMTTFTIIYFVAYADGVLVESIDEPLFHANSLADDSVIEGLFKSLSDAIAK